MLERFDQHITLLYNMLEIKCFGNQMLERFDQHITLLYNMLEIKCWNGLISI